MPECILFVTHRVTKYPLLIEPLIKTSRDQEQEITNLTKALQLVKVRGSQAGRRGRTVG